MYEGVQNRKKCCGLIAHTGSVAVKRGVAATTAAGAGDIYIQTYIYIYININIYSYFQTFFDVLYRPMFTEAVLKRIIIMNK